MSPSLTASFAFLSQVFWAHHRWLMQPCSMLPLFTLAASQPKHFCVSHGFMARALQIRQIREQGEQKERKQCSWADIISVWSIFPKDAHCNERCSSQASSSFRFMEFLDKKITEKMEKNLSKASCMSEVVGLLLPTCCDLMATTPLPQLLSIANLPPPKKKKLSPLF